jgi:hypothetical protein
LQKGKNTYKEKILNKLYEEYQFKSKNEKVSEIHASGFFNRFVHVSSTNKNECNNALCKHHWHMG